MIFCLCSTYVYGFKGQLLYKDSKRWWWDPKSCGWGSLATAWDWSGENGTRVSISILGIMANVSHYLSGFVYNAVFFPLQDKRKPHERAKNVRLFLGLLAWLRTVKVRSFFTDQPYWVSDPRLFWILLNSQKDIPRFRSQQIGKECEQFQYAHPLPVQCLTEHSLKLRSVLQTMRVPRLSIVPESALSLNAQLKLIALYSFTVVQGSAPWLPSSTAYSFTVCLSDWAQIHLRILFNKAQWNMMALF